MFVVVVMLFGDRYANPIVTRTGTLEQLIWAIDDGKPFS
jgi:hypothetical protein